VAGDGSGTARLATGETRRTPVVVTAPKDTSPGTVKLGVKVRGGLEPMSLWVDVHVSSTFDVDLAPDSSVLTLTPPGTVTLPFTMLSSGNSPGSVRLSVEGVPFGWDTTLQTPEGLATVSYDLDMGEARTAHLAVKVPIDAVGQEHPIDLVARSNDGLLLDRQTIFVRLRAPDLTVMDLFILPLEPQEGEPLTIRARVLNLGMADAEDVSVVLKDGSRVMDRDTLSIVPRLGELDVVLYMVPGSGTRTLTIEVDPGNEIRELSEVNNIVKRRVRIAEAPEEPLMSPGAAGASVVAVVTLSIIGAIGGTEYGKYAFLTLIFIPLYTKLKKDRVLDHYLRGKIHGYIIANPGEHYNAIKEQLEVTNGALSYHLRVLEREGYVRSRMDGIYKRFYPSDMKLPTTQRNISSFQEVILTIVKNNQGLSQKDIAKRIGASSQVINYHIKILEDGGLIEVDRSRRKSRVFATDAPATNVIE
jgi:DNA-binding MarR family transcriptional regulator